MKKSIISLEFEQLILAKEAELELEGRLLKIHFQQAYESLKPLNLIKSTIKQVISGPDLKGSLVDTAMGYATGIIAKKIILGKTHNPFTKLLGTIIEMAVANKVSKNAGEIKTIGGILFKKLIHQNGISKQE